MKLNEKELNTVKGTRLFRGAPETVLRKVLAATDCEVRDFERERRCTAEKASAAVSAWCLTAV